MATRKLSAAERIRSQCLAMRLRRLNRVVTRIYDEALREHGLTSAQLSLLTAISLRGPVRPAELGRALELERSTLSRNLRRMEEERWIAIDDAGDGHGRLLALTGRGAKLLETALPSWERAQRRASDLLGHGVFETLDRLALAATRT